MRTTDEIREILGDGEIAHVSMNFFMSMPILEEVTTMHEDVNHPTWKELLIYQNAWVDCMIDYKLNFRN